MADSSSHERLRAWQEDGDLDALDEVLRHEMSALKAMILSRNPGLHRQTLGATDAAQEAVLALLELREVPRFKTPRALRAYLWKAAWRLLQRRLERKGKLPQQLDTASTVGFERAAFAMRRASEEEEAKSRNLALNLALNLLRPRDREILECVYFEELDIARAAERLGVGRDAANMRLVRARRALAEKLADWNEVVR